LSELVVNAGRVHRESVLQSREPARKEQFS
jgi:hypothetical protein